MGKTMFVKNEQNEGAEERAIRRGGSYQHCEIVDS